MKVRITIEAELPDHVPGYGDGANTLHAVRYLICDAFGEFISHRTPTEKYIDDRYSGPGYEWVDKEEKYSQVETRKLIAEKLACRMIGEYGQMKIEEIT